MAAPRVQPLPDAAEVGRVMATLDDWRAITFILVVLLFIAVLERGLAAYNFSLERKAAATERERMWQIAQSMGANAEKIAEAMTSLAVEVRALRLVGARLESTMHSDV